jgi:hypothetical protein
VMQRYAKTVILTNVFSFFIQTNTKTTDSQLKKFQITFLKPKIQFYQNHSRVKKTTKHHKATSIGCYLKLVRYDFEKHFSKKNINEPDLKQKKLSLHYCQSKNSQTDG